MSAEQRVIFALGARLHMSAAAIEGLSRREVLGWLEFYESAHAAQATAANDGAVPVSSLSRDQLRAMFNHGHA